ncbi:MAG: 2TM domain-containing protein [Promethearchaeota archaeon]
MTENNTSKEKSNFSKFLANRIVFLIHLFLYVGVNLLLVLIWGLTGAGVFWPIGSIFGWGIAMSLHSVAYLGHIDKENFLSKTFKEGNTIKTLFVYHCTLYTSIMLLLFMVDIMKAPITGNFVYPVVIWGILLVVHAIGFSKLDSKIEKQSKILQEKYPEYSEKQAKKEASSKIARVIILFMHVGLFIVLNALLYIFRFSSLSPSGKTEFVFYTIAWACVVVTHGLGYFLKYFTKIKAKWTTLIINIVGYGILSAGVVIRNSIIETLPFRYWQYPVVLWGIWVGVLLIMTFIWESLIKRATTRITSNGRNADIEEFEVQSKAKRLVFWMGSFITHILVYIAGILLMNSSATDVYSIYGLGILFIPALGWLIGLATHGIIVFIIWKPVKNNLNRSIIAHIVIYIFTSILLVFINLHYTPGFLWCLIAMGGWGLGLGFHVLLKAMKKK